MICKNCNEITTNPIFCNSSCSAQYNNKKFPKRKPEQKCKNCSNPTTSRRKYCNDCKNYDKELIWPKKRRKTFNKTKLNLEEQAQRYKKKVGNSELRRWARKYYINSNKPKKCMNCGYDKHYEVCHIIPVADFPEDISGDVINSLDNLIALCKNCHWEFDNGLLSLNNINE